MSDLTAVQLEAQETPAQLASTWLEDVSTHVKGLVSILALAFVGMVLVVAALMAGVVGAPLIAAGIAYAIVVRRRSAR